MLESTASLGDFLNDLWIVKTMKYVEECVPSKH